MNMPSKENKKIKRYIEETEKYKKDNDEYIQKKTKYDLELDIKKEILENNKKKI
jgi:hypothetical protein